MLRPLVLTLALLSSGCSLFFMGGETPDGGHNDSADSGERVNDAGKLHDAGLSAGDAGWAADAGHRADGGNTPDSGTPHDAGSARDAGDTADAGTVQDAGSPADAGLSHDAGTFVLDAGSLVPASWTCGAERFGDNICDCGCRALDIDCDDFTSDVCDTNTCPATQEPIEDDNTQCDPQCTNLSWDTDGDGLTLAEENAAGTDCLNIDTDGDGFCDGQPPESLPDCTGVDLCPAVWSTGIDSDDDGVGNRCDTTPFGPPGNFDEDGDTIYDEIDNCPGADNGSQDNVDGDAFGDACDPDNTTFQVRLFFDGFNTALGPDWVAEDVDVAMDTGTLLLEPAAGKTHGRVVWTGYAGNDLVVKTRVQRHDATPQLVVFGAGVELSIPQTGAATFSSWAEAAYTSRVCLRRHANANLTRDWTVGNVSTGPAIDNAATTTFLPTQLATFPVQITGRNVGGMTFCGAFYTGGSHNIFAAAPDVASGFGGLIVERRNEQWRFSYASVSVTVPE